MELMAGVLTVLPAPAAVIAGATAGALHEVNASAIDAAKLA